MGLEGRLAKATSHGSCLVFVSLWVVANVYLPSHFWLLKYNTLESKGDVPFNPGNDPSTLQSKVLFKCFCVFLKVSCLLSWSMTALTMCRWTWTQLSQTWVRKFLPLDKFEAIHKWCAIVGWIELLSVTVIYLINWKKLCDYYRAGNEDWNFCADFYSEIMITGYLLTFFHTAIVVLSLRAVRRKNYELFYWSHHLFIAILLLGIFHPMDWRHRKGAKERMQTWPVLILPVTLYFLDRTIQIMTHRWTTCHNCVLLMEPKTIFLKLHAPTGFLNQRPGMICWLNAPSVSWLNWHPFSIAHTDEVGSLHLIIHVIPKGWTESLWNALVMCTPHVPFTGEGLKYDEDHPEHEREDIIRAMTHKFNTQQSEDKIATKNLVPRIQMSGVHRSSRPSASSCSDLETELEDGRELPRLATYLTPRPLTSFQVKTSETAIGDDSSVFRVTRSMAETSRDKPKADASVQTDTVRQPIAQETNQVEMREVASDLPGGKLRHHTNSVGSESDTYELARASGQESDLASSVPLLGENEAEGRRPLFDKREGALPKREETRLRMESGSFMEVEPALSRGNSEMEFCQDRSPGLTETTISDRDTIDDHLHKETRLLQKFITGEDIGRGLFRLRHLWAEFQTRYRKDALTAFSRQLKYKRDLIDMCDLNYEVWLDNIPMIKQLQKWSGTFGLSGPFTAGVPAASHYDHAILVGAGSGIVPCLSHVTHFIGLKNLTQKPKTQTPLTEPSPRDRNLVSLMSPRDRSFRQEFHNMIETSPFWSFFWYIYIVVEFTIGVGSLGMSVNRSLERNGLGKILWPFFAAMHVICALLFLAHRICMSIAKAGKKSYSTARLLQSSFDWCLAFASIAFLVVNWIGKVNTVEADVLISESGWHMRGGIISALTWDYVCHITTVGGYFCDLRLMARPELWIATTVFIGIFICSTCRWCRVWAQTPRLLTEGPSMSGALAPWEKELGLKQSSQLRTIKLIWIMRTPSWLLQLEAEVLRVLNVFHPGFELEVYLTGSGFTEDKLDKLFPDPLLRKRISLGRPDLSEIFSRTCDKHMKGIARGEKVAIYASGPQSMQMAAKVACDQTSAAVWERTGGKGGQVSWHAEKFG